MTAPNVPRPKSLTCLHCGKPFKIGPAGRIPDYCSAKCRVYNKRAIERVAPHLPYGPRKKGGRK